MNRVKHFLRKDFGQHHWTVILLVSLTVTFLFGWILSWVALEWGIVPLGAILAYLMFTDQS